MNRPVSIRLRQESAFTAWQVTEGNLDEVAKWCGGHVVSDENGRPAILLDIASPFCTPGYWVIRNPDDGHFFGWPAETFDDHYEVGRASPTDTGRRVFDLNTRTWRHA